MSKYFFLHPKTMKVCDIRDGRSLWEDHIDKDEFIVVKELGPAMQHWEEAMRVPPTEVEKMVLFLEYSKRDLNEAAIAEVTKIQNHILSKEPR